MSARKVTRRAMLHFVGTSALAGFIAACQPKVVEKIVKETVPVEATRIVEKEKPVTAVVEKVVTPTPAPKPKGTVSIGVLGTAVPITEVGRDRLATAYKDIQPNVELKWVGPPEGGDYAAWLGTMLAAQPIEIDLCSGNYVASYPNYVDLDKYRKAANPYSGHKFDEDLDFDFFEARTASGMRYMIPTRAVHVGWFYNKAIFDKANVKPPKSWPEFVEVASKIKAIGVVPCSVNWSLCITQWLEHPYVDQFLRKDRYDFGGAQKGDWNYDPAKDGVFKYDGKDPHNNRKFTFNTQRWLKNVKDGKFRYDDPRLTTVVKNWSQMWPKYAPEDVYVLQDYYVPFLQQKAAMTLGTGGTIPSLVRDMRALDDARREQLKLGKDAKIEAFAWGQFNHPGMIDPGVAGPIRTSESATGEYISVVQKAQAQTDLVMDFLLFWLSPKGYQTWLDGLFLKNYNPGGPLMIKGVKDHPEFAQMFAEVEMIGSSSYELYNLVIRVGAFQGAQHMDVLQKLKDTFDGKATPEAFTKFLHQQHTDPNNWPIILKALNLTDADVDHPERKPGS